MTYKHKILSTVSCKGYPQFYVLCLRTEGVRFFAVSWFVAFFLANCRGFVPGFCLGYFPSSVDSLW